MKKRSPELNKAVTYIRGKIRRKTWEIGQKADSISQISKDIKISKPTVKKAVTILESKSLLENRGIEGIWVIGQLTKNMSSVMKLSSIQSNLTAAKLLSNGGIFDKNNQTILCRTNDILTIFFPIKNNKISLKISSIENIRKNLIHIQDVLNKNVCRSKLKNYKEQLQVISVLDIIIPHKKELDIEI